MAARLRNAALLVTSRQDEAAFPNNVHVFSVSQNEFGTRVR
jgi:hypothetical protein